MKTPAKKAAKAAAPKAKAKVVASPKKAAAKAPVKPLAKPKTAAKKPVKAAPVKKALVAKKAVPAKPVKAAKPVASKKPVPAKKTAKSVAKPVVKTPAKAAVKAVAKTPVSAKAAPAKAVPKKQVPAKVAATPVAKTTPQKKVEPAKTPAPKAAAPVAVAAAPDQPVRSTRPSARLAQITVPSLPPAVASTAAKASYFPNMSTSVLSAPPVVPVKKDAKLANNWKNKTVEQLTDAEILAMPDGEYMNDLQMAYFRRKLVGLKQDILANAGETTEHLREDTVVVPDPADRATIEEEHALELRTRDRERKLLKKIEQSIVRIDAGDYGYCDETGEPIGVGRLLARPTATLSLEAQQRRELKQKMFGD